MEALIHKRVRDDSGINKPGYDDMKGYGPGKKALLI
jgi:hypothetical protein